MFGFDGLARTGEVISKIGINHVLPPLMPRSSYFRGPLRGRVTVDEYANCILQIFRNGATNASNTETGRIYNETREAVWGYVVEIAHDKMLDVQRAVKSGIRMEREFDQALVDFQKEFQASSLSHLLAKGWVYTAKITDKLQADSLFVSGEPISDGPLAFIPEIAVGFDERIRDIAISR